MQHTLYFIRHGETGWNRVGRLQGHKDIALSDRGRAQARSNGKLLKQYLEDKSFQFVSSPLIRACETMEIIRTELGLPPHDYALEPRLQENSFGVHEGYTRAEIKQQFPEHESIRAANPWRYQPPEGESYAMLAERVQNWLEGVQQDMVVVAHGGVCRVLRKLFLNLDEEKAASFHTPQDKVMRMHNGNLTWLESQPFGI